MMGAVQFDTLAYVKRMKRAGFTEQQAEAQAEALAELIEGDLATKRDLKELEAAMCRDLAEAKAELVKWVVSVGIVQTGIIAGLLLALVK